MEGTSLFYTWGTLVQKNMAERPRKTLTFLLSYVILEEISTQLLLSLTFYYTSIWNDFVPPPIISMAFVRNVKRKHLHTNPIMWQA